MKHPNRVLITALYMGVIVATTACSTNTGNQDTTPQDSETTQSETASSTGETTDTTTSESETGEPDPIDYSQPGAHVVGNLAITLADPIGDRELTIELWYPASGDASGAGQLLLDFARSDAQVTTLGALLDAVDDSCVRKQTGSDDAPMLADIAGPLPTLVFSHCHGCARFSSFTIAEQLASHGFLVAAVDHAGSTIFEQLEDTLPPLDVATLELRRDDVMRVIDELLDPAASALPSEFVGLADGERLGVFGHSFGSITTGKVLQDDPRPRAGVGIAAPMENPLLPGILMANIVDPLMLFIAVEDNSITEFGNMAIRQNFTDANSPTWKLEFADTGHFGFSDLAGLSDYYAAGCGAGTRQTNGMAFDYADPHAVRELAAARVTAFFALHLLGDEDARAQLEAEDPLLDIAIK